MKKQLKSDGKWDPEKKKSATERRLKEDTEMNAQSQPVSQKKSNSSTLNLQKCKRLLFHTANTSRWRSQPPDGRFPPLNFRSNIALYGTRNSLTSRRTFPSSPINF